MNVITYAGKISSYGQRTAKNYEIIAPQGSCRILSPIGDAVAEEGEIAVIPPLVGHSFEGKGIKLEIDKALLPFKKITIVKDDGAGGIAHCAAQAESYFNGDFTGKWDLLAALGGLAVAYVTAFGGGKKLSPVVETVKAEVLKNLSTPSFSLRDSIKKLPLNYDYVRKLFKKETGLTPHEFLMESRMALAKELISSGIGNRYSNYSVSQIAEACGFSEPLYFSRVFKKYYGKSPSEFLNEK